MKTVYVLGAGSICDFGFPTGIELINNIYQRIITDSINLFPLLNEKMNEDEINKNIKELKNKDGITPLQNLKLSSESSGYYKTVAETQLQSEKMKNIANKLYYSGASSIDSFLAQYPEDDPITKLSKVCIFNDILAGEKRAIRESTNGVKEEPFFTVEESGRIKKAVAKTKVQEAKKEDKKVETYNYTRLIRNLFSFRENWLRIMFQKHFIKNDFNELKEKFNDGAESVDFIIFNYDRSIEHFLYTAIKNYYNCNEKDVKDFLGQITFFHIYGSIGKLPWQTENPEESLAYGGKIDDKKIPNFAKGINTIRAGKILSKPEDEEQIKRILNNTNILYILGLAYDQKNFTILEPIKSNVKETRPSKSVTTYITTLGYGKAERDKVHTEYIRQKDNDYERDEREHHCPEATAYELMKNTQ